MSLFTGAIATAIALGASSVASVASAKMNAGAADRAGERQASAAQEALDFTKAQKAKQEAAYAPFGALGQQAAAMLPGLARQAPVGGPPMPYTTQPRATAPMMPPNGMQPPSGSAMPFSGVGQQPQAQAPQMVMLQAPDGTTKSVPQAQAQFYLSRGAKAVS